MRYQLVQLKLEEEFSVRIIHTLLWYINKGKETDELKMVRECLKSLEKTADTCIVVYNQGYQTNDEVLDFLKAFNITFYILGSGNNIGIPAARQQCFEFIWNTFPDVEYISELHVDMIFPVDWDKPLIEFLDQTDEPIVGPGIITSDGELYPSNLQQTAVKIEIPEHLSQWVEIAPKYKEDRTIKGLTYPLIHKSEALKAIGGYDLQFLRGAQEFEDDSLLLGYLYYMGIKSNWYPKINLNSIVYHAIGYQRFNITGYQNESSKNLNGLFIMYGAMGFKHLADIHTEIRYPFFMALYQAGLNNLKD